MKKIFLLIILILMSRVVCAETLGFTSKASSSTTTYIWNGSRVYSEAPSTVSSISAYLSSGATSDQVNFGIYIDASTLPGDFVANGTAETPGAIDDWYTIDVDATLTKDEWYWIVVQQEGDYSVYWQSQDGEKTGGQSSYSFDTWTDDPSVNTWVKVESIYATITLDTPAITPTGWCAESTARLCSPFEDDDTASTSYDYTPYVKHGTAQNDAALLSSGCAGGTGKCWTFDGTGDSLELDSRFQIPEVDDDWSICFWVKGDDIGDTTNYVMGDPSTKRHYVKFARNGSLSVIAISDADNGWAIDKDTTTVPNDTWFHNCLVSNAGTMTWWYNGVAQADARDLTSDSDMFRITHLGVGGADSTDDLSGELDDVLILHNKAMVEAEILDVMNNGLGQTAGAVDRRTVWYN